jgi:hypothetical protein
MGFSLGAGGVTPAGSLPHQGVKSRRISRGVGSLPTVESRRSKQAESSSPTGEPILR